MLSKLWLERERLEGKKKGGKRRTAQSRHQKLKQKQEQREQASPGDSYLPIKSVIYSLTTGLRWRHFLRDCLPRQPNGAMGPHPRLSGSLITDALVLVN